MDNMEKFVLRKCLALGLLSIGLLAGCGGDMSAISSKGKSVEFRYEQGMSSDTYFATVGNESFKGRAVMVDANSTFGTAFGSAYSSYGSVSGTASTFGFSSGGKVKAVMIGSKGSTLRCLMQYADTSGFTTMGGVGECIHSDGSRIDVSW